MLKTGSNNLLFKCYVCDDSFSSFQAMRTHVLFNHSRYVEDCKITKLENYRNSKQGKEIMHKRKLEYYQENKDKIQEQNRKYYNKNKGKILETKTKYVKENKEKVIQFQKQWYKKNKVRIALKYQKNKDTILARKKQRYKEQK